MSDLCPICMNPLVEERRVEITMEPVIYDSVVADLEMDPVKASGPPLDQSVGAPGPVSEEATSSEQQSSSQA